MSLNSFPAHANIANRAFAHTQPLAERNYVPVNIDPRSQVEEQSEAKRSSLVDNVARQLGSTLSGMVAAPIAVKRMPSKVSGSLGKRRIDDDNYEGPVDLEQDEFAPPVTRVKRQGTSPGPTANFANGDIGAVFVRFADGTTQSIVDGNIVYATAGSDDGSQVGQTQLLAQIATSNGGAIVAGTPFALIDTTGDYVTSGDGSTNPYLGIEPSQNTGVPLWMAPEANARYLFTIDQTTGDLTVTYNNQVIQMAVNQNKVPYADGYTGNGDLDAWVQGSTIDSVHAAATLFLVKQ